MPLTLMAAEQRQLSAASATFLTPQDFPSVDSWRRECNQAMRALLRADCASFMLPTGMGVHLFSDEWPAAIPNAYPDRVATLDREHGFWRRQVEAGAWARRRLFTPAMYASSYFRDFVVPARAFDAIGMTVACATGRGLASVIFHHTSRRGPRFGDRAVQMLELLLPAFRSGVRAQLLLNSAPGLARLVDAVPPAPATASDADLTARFGLTRQQLRVAHLLGEGQSNREMAETLAVSVHTARRHTESVMAKLGVASRSRVPAILLPR
ncbi:hypothetical protein BH11GEM1_BH11GEM1_17200 [soil metagenome]